MPCHAKLRQSGPYRRKASPGDSSSQIAAVFPLALRERVRVRAVQFSRLRTSNLVLRITKSLDCMEQGFQHRVQVANNFVVPKPQYFDSLFGQEC